MPTAIALALLIASLPGLSWVSFSASAFSSPFSVSSTLPRTRLRICPLIAASFSRTILSNMVCFLFLDGVSQLHSARGLQTMSLAFVKLIALIAWMREHQ